jgi:hypothetical protein
MKDENRFLELMTVLGEIHDRKITRLLLDVYWRVLEPFPDEACIRAFHELIRSAKFFPKPAEFLELLEAKREVRAAGGHRVPAVIDVGVNNGIKEIVGSDGDASNDRCAMPSL